jgi:hypothetical protein
MTLKGVRLRATPFKVFSLSPPEKDMSEEYPLPPCCPAM